MIRALAFMVIAGWAANAAADLYRWVDPETGSIKFSSYPPPWYGDETKARRAPRVEVIPSRAVPPAAGERTEPPAAEKAASERPGGERASRSARTPEERRNALWREFAAQLQIVANSSPSDFIRNFIRAGQLKNEYEQLSRSANPGREASLQAQADELKSPLLEQWNRLLNQFSGMSAPAEGTVPEILQAQWEQAQQALAAIGSVEGALKLVDPGGEAARRAQIQALIEKNIEGWKLHNDPRMNPGAGRR